MTDLLYKYKSLENIRHFIDIILKNRLYASSYNKLNDPMEGMYYYRTGELDRFIRDKLREEKGQLRLCSLSKINNNELMWSHYADGQHGVAIGVKIDMQQYDIRSIQYCGLQSIRNQDFNSQTAKEILCHKLEDWDYEQEKRVFVCNKNYINIEIEEIITGRAMSSSDYNFVKDLIRRLNHNIQIIT
jgi:hypothetical protein